MKRVWLLRHAKSSWDDPLLADEDRPLAPRGRRAAELIADHLAAAGVRPDLVLCSSARRTRETLARALPSLGRSLAIAVEPALYTFDREVLISRLASVPSAVRSVLVIGHNPAMQETATWLAAEGPRLPELRAKFPTAALATLDLDVDAWDGLRLGCATLVGFVTPRELDHQT